ncbi:MAG: hypothetical protein H6960_08125 [Chromatiaceae bacterium]|nr:hypothetical protein [Chromatiaceae bacterium]MCP5438111.1 hypothetical protein [Chromatiaceae bacterium]
MTTETHETTLSSELDTRLSTLAAVADLLGSAPADELAVDTLPQIAGLMERLADEAHDLAEELWSRLREARVEAGAYPSLEDIAPRDRRNNENAAGTGTADGAKDEADEGRPFRVGDQHE